MKIESNENNFLTLRRKLIINLGGIVLWKRDF